MTFQQGLFLVLVFFFIMGFTMVAAFAVTVGACLISVFVDVVLDRFEDSTEGSGPVLEDLGVSQPEGLRPTAVEDVVVPVAVVEFPTDVATPVNLDN